jgi:CAAX prenyl protease-like protein
MAVPMIWERFGIVPLSQRTFAGPRPPGADWPWLGVVAGQVLVGGGLLVAWWGNYVRWLPLRVSVGSVGLGLVGLLLWVGICELDWERQIWSLIPWEAFQPGPRPSVIPGEWFPDLGSYLAFLFFRFLGLVVIVPIAEELLLRGFFLRMIQQEDWWNLPMNRLSPWAIGVSAAYGAVTHPNEILAAVVWFAAVTAWVRWTNRFWDGVMIHAVTNAALGGYVIGFQQWHLW